MAQRMHRTPKLLVSSLWRDFAVFPRFSDWRSHLSGSPAPCRLSKVHTMAAILSFSCFFPTHTPSHHTIMTVIRVYDLIVQP
jgi:hypothetical protein